MNLILVISAILIALLLFKKNDKGHQTSFSNSISTIKQINKVTKNNSNINLYTEWKTKSYFFSKSELFFYRELIDYTSKKNALVHSKVRIADLVEPKHRLNYSDFNKTFRRITQKHVDYVITDFSGRILCVLELDGKSHESGKTVENDIFKNEFFDSIGLELIRFKNYSIHNLSQLDKVL